MPKACHRPEEITGDRQAAIAANRAAVATRRGRAWRAVIRASWVAL